MEDDDDLPPQLIDVNERHPEEDSAAPPIPVTIITGYLGSGKSTLLRHITSTYSNKKIAVVLNEFGQTSDIERTLTLRNQNADGTEVDQWIELDNGCMCCTAKDAGVSAIEKLIERHGRYDNIIIETSGLADPAPIANTFWLDDALMARVKLDGVVTVVDAQTIMRSLDDGPLASLQIACSDVVLINKVDTVSAEEVAAVQSRVHAINGAAKTARCSFGSVPLDSILNIDAYSCHQRSSSGLGLDEARSTDAKTHGHFNHGISTVVILLDATRFNEKSGLDRFEANLQKILWSRELDGRSYEIHRAKAKLQCGQRSAHPTTKIVQCVRETYEITKAEYEPDGECKLVLIGRDIKPLERALVGLFNGPEHE